MQEFMFGQNSKQLICNAVQVTRCKHNDPFR